MIRLYPVHMRLFPPFSLVFILFITIACSKIKQEHPVAPAPEVWITSMDKSHLLKRISIETSQSTPADSILIDSTKVYQTVDGFGYSLTGGSAMLLHTRLDSSRRHQLLNELFSDHGIAISYLRISIGASDLDERVFSYSDLGPGETDPEHKRFSIAPDKTHLIPVLKEILQINPDLKIMASPWSAPLWMKTNGRAKGGSLQPRYYASYAEYFVRYISAMREEGINIDAITIQNEPEHPGNTPSMVMTADEQALFVKEHLGPAFRKANITTKILIFDHNADHPQYPIAVLNDSAARAFIDGSAFHLYLGEISALSHVKAAHPDKNIYFTEQWTSGNGDFGGDLQWHVRHLIVGAMRNWSKTVLEWNLAADPEFKPHTDDGGCTMCLGALTISSDSVKRNVSFYIIAHASKFVRPGSIRIESTNIDSLPNVAFKTPDGGIVLIASNEEERSRSIVISFNQTTQTFVIPQRSVATVVMGRER